MLRSQHDNLTFCSHTHRHHKTFSALHFVINSANTSQFTLLRIITLAIIGKTLPLKIGNTHTRIRILKHLKTVNWTPISHSCSTTNRLQVSCPLTYISQSDWGILVGLVLESIWPPTTCGNIQVGYPQLDMTCKMIFSPLPRQGGRHLWCAWSIKLCTPSLTQLFMFISTL